VGRAQAGPYWFDHIEVSNRLADFATQAEIDGAIAAIKDVWRALGRQMKSASSIEIEEIRYRRAGVSRAFKAMREGDIPGVPLECRCGVPPALLAPFDARREATLEAAVQRAIKAMPIDDAAWATELEWRRRVDSLHDPWRPAFAPASAGQSRLAADCDHAHRPTHIRKMTSKTV
jgi:hypothetical protein